MLQCRFDVMNETLKQAVNEIRRLRDKLTIIESKDSPYMTSNSTHRGRLNNRR